jgi:toxin-antitoxin system PIN domain toxin
VILLDANILLYAYDSEAPQHAASAKWLHRLMRGPEIVGIPWQTIWAFVRIRTNIRLVRRPQPPEATFQIVREWLALPGIVMVQPGPLHAELLEKLVVGHQATGPLLSDAVLAALAIEHGAVLASTDRDFSRFPDIRWVNPLGSDA